MSWIIRLQHLPLSAVAADIRIFFAGLKIPDGAVHIVGGPDGDAFIGFATDEDARQAMRFDNRRIHDQRVRLLLSSRVEMDAVIAKARAGGLNLNETAVAAGVAAPPQAAANSPRQRDDSPVARAVQMAQAAAGTAENYRSAAQTQPTISDICTAVAAAARSGGAAGAAETGNDYYQSDYTRGISIIIFHAYTNCSSSNSKLNKKFSLPQSTRSRIPLSDTLLHAATLRRCAHHCNFGIYPKTITLFMGACLCVRWYPLISGQKTHGCCHFCYQTDGLLL